MFKDIALSHFLSKAGRLDRTAQAPSETGSQSYCPNSSILYYTVYEVHVVFM